MTTTTDLAVREEAAPALHVPALPGLPDTDTWIRAMASIAKLASMIAHTSFVPDGMRGDEGAVTAAILTGRELGMGPMQSLRNIHVIKGVPSLRAEFKRAKVLAGGHEFRILEWDARHCKVAARRKGDRGEPTVVEYTITEADRAGLVKRNDNYRTDPMAMLMARATTRVANAIFADVTNGLATTELLGDDDALAEAVGAALELPAQPRPEVGDLRQRAAAQTVTAQVVEPRPAPAAPAAVPEPAAAPASGETEPPASPEPASDVSAEADPALKSARAQARRVFGDDRGARLLWAARIIGAEDGAVRSFTHLTPEELRLIAATLAKVRDTAALGRLLETGEAGE